VAAAETVTKGGIVLTESAQRKPTSGASTRSTDARALEDGRRDRATRAGDKGRHPNLEGLTAGRAARRARREWIDARTRATRED
jgi:co-chaperonin GroES (HSP10)